MEDEEGELFNNTYLDDLKNGGMFYERGRESITQDELNRRNSMYPPHLRSSYVPYADQNATEDDKVRTVKTFWCFQSSPASITHNLMSNTLPFPLRSLVWGKRR